MSDESEDEYIERVTRDLQQAPWREKDDPEWVKHWQGNMRLRYRLRQREKRNGTLSLRKERVNGFGQLDASNLWYTSSREY